MGVATTISWAYITVMVTLNNKMPLPHTKPTRWLGPALIAAVLLLSCSNDNGPLGTDQTDDDPERITDLRLDSTVHGSIYLSWTAVEIHTEPGGPDPAYDFRRAADSSTLIEWTNARAVGSPPHPGPAGSHEQLVVRGLYPDTAYYFGVRIYGDPDGPSPLSNIAGSTPFDDFIVLFPDTSLETVVREHAGVPEGDIFYSALQGLTSFQAEARGIISLSGLQYLRNLEHLHLQHNQIRFLWPLQSLTNLRFLYLWSNVITDIDPLSGLKSLHSLHLDLNRISDIAALSDLSGLRQLDLADNPVSNLEPLASLSRLESLTLGDESSIDDITPLASLDSLLYLSVKSDQLSDLGPLSGLTSLRQLTLTGPGMNDVAPLSTLSNLVKLGLNGNGIIDIEPLYGLTNLQVLDLGNNQIGNIDSLYGMTDLRALHLENNFIAEVDVLALMPHLSYLHLGGNRVRNIDILAPLTGLQYIYLNDNDISNIDALANLAALDYLDLQNNQITRIFPLAKNAGLGSGDQVYLYGNPLGAMAIGKYLPLLRSRGVSVYF